MKSILVVDDEQRIRHILGEILRRKGFDLLEADDAVTAHQILTSGRRVDLLLLDINMPDIQGDTLYEVVQSFHYKTRVIVCSVFPVEEQNKRVPNAVDYYDKSESFSILIQKIELALNGECPQKRILIIDDDPYFRLLYRKLLQKEGHFPLEASDHPDTFRFLRKYFNNIDIILLDIAMPCVTGTHFFTMIRREYPDAKIIITSAFPLDRQRTAVPQANDYYDKSESLGILLQKIKTALGAGKERTHEYVHPHP